MTSTLRSCSKLSEGEGAADEDHPRVLALEGAELDAGAAVLRDLVDLDVGAEVTDPIDVGVVDGDVGHDRGVGVEALRRGVAALRDLPELAVARPEEDARVVDRDRLRLAHLVGEDLGGRRRSSGPSSTEPEASRLQT